MIQQLARVSNPSPSFIYGSTHTTYCKTLQNALGMKTVNARVFLNTIEKMYPVVKSMVDDLCEAAKQEMKGKNDGDLGSWKRAVTTADGTWQTRGWHSKNATFTIRVNGALLYSARREGIRLLRVASILVPLNQLCLPSLTLHITPL